MAVREGKKKCAYHEGEKGCEEGLQQVPGETKPDGDVWVVVVVGASAVFDAVHSELVYSVRALVYEATHRWATKKKRKSSANGLSNFTREMSNV
jgi:hypothetical protein